MFSQHKEIKALENERLEHEREISRQSSARYREKHKNDVKVEKARGTLKIYDEYQEKEKQVPEFVGY